jgi:hypothetical protein
MQMIDVLKRLAELDKKNPNIVKENKIEECEPMGDMQSPKTPATLNITAANGEELGDMLNAIMQLAGVHAVGDEHLGTESPPTVLTTEPGMSRNDQDADSMRTMLDRMNHMSDEAADESMEHDHGIPGVDNVPADPQKQLPFAPNEFSQNTNNGDGKDKHGHPRLTTQPTATYEDLMNEYQNFLKESEITELAKWRDTKYKDKLYTQEPRSSDDDYYGDADYYDPKPDDYPGAKRLHGGGEFDNNDPLDMRHDITRHSDDPEMWGYGTITSKGPRKGLPTKSVVNSLKDKIKKHQGAHPNPTLPENKDAYERDYLSSIAGMDGSDKRDFKRREMEHELGHETNNYSVDINGRTWKVFASKSHAESVAKKIMMRDPSKKVSVHETGAEVSEDMVPTVDQGEYDREGDMVKDNLMTIKREVEELYKILDNNENVPEWVEDKIAQVKGMMTSASEYMQTQHERGEEHDMMEEGLAEGSREMTGTARDRFISTMTPRMDNNALMQKVAKVVNSPEFNSDTILKIVDSPNITHPVGRYIQKEFDELQYDLGRAYEDYPERVAEKLLSMLQDRTQQGVAEGKVCSSCNMPMKKCSCD